MFISSSTEFVYILVRSSALDRLVYTKDFSLIYVLFALSGLLLGEAADELIKYHVMQ